MMVQLISAVTFAAQDMQAAVEFYQKLGFNLTYGDPTSRFCSLRSGEAFVNLILSPDYIPRWWGRTIFRVDQVDELYESARDHGLSPDRPRDATWGERFFHITDPNGHELSFAQLLNNG